MRLDITILVLFASCFFVYACSMEGNTEQTVSRNEKTIIQTDISVITIEEALDSLSVFLSNADPSFTKSGNQKEIASIEVHYSSTFLDKSGFHIPDAYLINFLNDEGFAVLGAHSQIAPIVAVIDKGNITWDQIMGNLQEHSNISDDLLAYCIRSALYGEDAEEDEEIMQTKGESSTVDVMPLTTGLNFGQNVTYCHKSNMGFVTNGCASTAIGIIVTHNNYPRFYTDHEYLDYGNCTVQDGNGLYFYLDNDEINLQLSDYYTNPGDIPTPTTDAKKVDLLTRIDPGVINTHNWPDYIFSSYPFYRTRYKLTSSIFYILNNIIQSWDGTCTMPSAAVDGLTALGYKGVFKNQKGSLKDNQIDTIRMMLTNNLPVLMCGWSLFTITKSHYWVVDGIMGSGANTLIHCNWGDFGNMNGWFSRSCLRKNSAVVYDTPPTKSNDGNQWNHIIVFSYRKKVYLPVITVNEVWNKRVTYNE